jgi:hypothetical protein
MDQFREPQLETPRRPILLDIDASRFIESPTLQIPIEIKTSLGIVGGLVSRGEDRALSITLGDQTVEVAPRSLDNINPKILEIVDQDQKVELKIAIVPSPSNPFDLKLVITQTDSKLAA